VFLPGADVLTYLAGDGDAHNTNVQRLHTQILSLTQLRTNFQQLIIAMTASAQALQRLQQEMSALMSSADALVQSLQSVPKHKILPIFHKTGQLFEVCWTSTQGRLGPRLHILMPVLAEFCLEASF
jgi:hypothetical protein